MLETNIDEVASALTGAKNLNSALKAFLKKEGTNAPHIVQFAKEFRGIVATGRTEPVRNFIERNYEKRPMVFLGLARYAYPELIEATVGNIIERYADEFNATYERVDDGVRVTDAKSFSAIVKGVGQMIEEGLHQAGVSPTNFMRNTIMASVFEPDVLREVMKVVSA
jgi:hypothetical protein